MLSNKLHIVWSNATLGNSKKETFKCNSKIAANKIISKRVKAFISSAIFFDNKYDSTVLINKTNV